MTFQLILSLIKNRQKITFELEWNFKAHMSNDHSILYLLLLLCLFFSALVVCFVLFTIEVTEKIDSLGGFLKDLQFYC